MYSPNILFSTLLYRIMRSPKKRKETSPTSTRLADPETGQYTTRVFTDFSEFQKTLLGRTKELISVQCRNAISDNFIRNTANTKDKNKFWVIATKPDRGGLAGFASATLYQDAVSGLPTVYLDLVCSNTNRGTSLVNTVMVVGQAVGAKLARLSALSKVVGYYQKNFGFTRVPNACTSSQAAYPRVPGTRNHKNFGPLYMHPSKAGNYDGENYGYVMSKCLPRAPWNIRQRFRNLGLTFGGGAQWNANAIVGDTHTANLVDDNIAFLSTNVFKTPKAGNAAYRLFPTQNNATMKNWWGTKMKTYKK